MTSPDAFLETLAGSGLPPLIGRRHAGGDFRGGIVTHDLGPLRLAELVTPEGECFRDAGSARDADSELWQIELVTRGRVRAEQGRNTAVLEPGDLVLIDPVRPVSFATTATTSVTMTVPRGAGGDRPHRGRRRCPLGVRRSGALQPAVQGDLWLQRGGTHGQQPCADGQGAPGPAG